MPISEETAARTESPVDTPIYEKQSFAPDNQPDPYPASGSESGQPSLPSETVQPGVAEDASQQGATQPGSGFAVPASGAGAGAGANLGHQPSFKEKVVGYAKKTRGATLGKHDMKEQGERILSGQEVYEPKKVGPGARKERSGSM